MHPSAVAKGTKATVADIGAFAVALSIFGHDVLETSWRLVHVLNKTEKVCGMSRLSAYLRHIVVVQ